MKISKRTREQAALICAVMASQDEAVGNVVDDLGIARGWDATKRAGGLAWLARNEAENRNRPDTDKSARWAEAEALLRCGWSP